MLNLDCKFRPWVEKLVVKTHYFQFLLLLMVQTRLLKRLLRRLSHSLCFPSILLDLLLLSLHQLVLMKQVLLLDAHLQFLLFDLLLFLRFIKLLF